MESALRTVIELVTGRKVESIYEHGDIMPVRGFEGVRYAEVTITEVGPVPDILAHLVPNWDWLKGATLKVAVAHGTANARKVMEDIKAGGKFSQCHFIEFMACPGGCLGGGGQPIPTSEEIRAARARPSTPRRRPQRAQVVREPGGARIYEEFLTDGPCGHKSHELLHTQLHAARQAHRVDAGAGAAHRRAACAAQTAPSQMGARRLGRPGHGVARLLCRSTRLTLGHESGLR